MKREIKFRAWDKFNKIMYSPIDLIEIVELFHDKITLNNVEWLQYTGLKDKNGVEIYEGDTLKSSVGNLTVNWNENLASFCVDKDGWVFSHFFKEALEPDEVEVIGNIHENPELLK